MAKVQLELNDMEEHIISMIKAFNRLKSKREAIKFLINKNKDILDKIE